MKKQNKLYAVGLITCIILTILIPIVQLYLPKASFWNLTTPFHIDDSNPSIDWNYYSTTYDWCSGSGTWNDPYVIENMSIDAGGGAYGIKISNSIVPFIIRNCTITGGLFNGLYMDNVQNGTITNSQFIGNGAGLGMENCVNNTIENNLAINNIAGMDVWFSTQNRFIHNDLIFNVETGLFLFKSNENNITYNNVSYNPLETGINSEQCISNNISLNFLTENSNIQIDLYGSVNTTIYGNIISKGVIGVKSTQGENNTINRNYLTQHEAGILFNSEKLSNITDNTILNGDYGVMLSAFNSNNTVIGNLISNHTLKGIEIILSIERNIIFRNIIKDSGFGIHTSISEKDLIYYNCFMNNTDHAYSLNSIGTTYWDNGTHGNYYDNYTGMDVGLDGIGDEPYNISGNSGEKDYYPLMECPLIPPDVIDIPSDIGADLQNGDETLPDLTWIWILIIVLGVSIPSTIGLIYYLRKRNRA